MLQAPQIDGIENDLADWVATPVSIQQLVVHVVAENEALKTRLSQIEEQLRQNSQNSSKPPSQDGFGKKAPALKDRSKKLRGDQPGHAGNQPKFYDLSAGDMIQEHIPTNCAICGEALTGKDEAPYRHQILELPVLRPQITEHRLYNLIANIVALQHARNCRIVLGFVTMGNA